MEEAAVGRPRDREKEWSVVRGSVYRGARAQGAPHHVAEDLAQEAVERWLARDMDSVVAATIARSRGRFDAKSWHRRCNARTTVPLADQIPARDDVLTTAIRRERLATLKAEAAEFRSRVESLEPVVRLALARKLRDGWCDGDIAAEQARLRGRRIGRTAVVHQRRRLLKNLPAVAVLAGDRKRENGASRRNAGAPSGSAVSDLSAPDLSLAQDGLDLSQPAVRVRPAHRTRTQELG
jgi:DNA-directed RNA polymerase specialized sigma24 family protein